MLDKRYYFFGYFGFTNNQLDGQTIKTRDFKRLFDEVLRVQTTYYDTQNLKKNPLSLIKALFKVHSNDTIIILPGARGLKFLMPVIFMWSVIHRNKIYYVVIGGWLPIFIRKNPGLKFFLKRLSRIFVETNNMRINLAEIGLNNISMLPNFKFHNFERNWNQDHSRNETLNIVFISRVTKDKGLDIIRKILYKIEGSDLPFRIDLYGPIKLQEIDYVNDILRITDKVKYCGVLEINDVHNIISKYDVMLFPTHYEGEGFPGVILDAFIAGIPVIASNWKYNSELITEKVGFLFNLNQWESIITYFKWLYDNPTKLAEMKRQAYRRREEYSIKKLIQILKEEGLFNNM